MGHWKTDSDGRKTILYPSNGVDNAADKKVTSQEVWTAPPGRRTYRIYATPQGLCTKAGGNGNPDADPEVLVACGDLDDAWGLAHVRGFEWKRNIRSAYKAMWNSEATLILPDWPNYTMEDYHNRIRVWDYSWNTGDWRGWIVACTVHFSEPVWVTDSPRLKVIFTEPGKSAVTKYLTYKCTDMYTTNGSGYWDQYYDTEVAGYNATYMATGYDDYISSINVTNGGSGYVFEPQISFGHDDSGQLPSELPRAYAVIKDGEVTSINITYGGSGYNYQLVPTVVFDNTGTGGGYGHPDGGGAAATAIRTNRGDGTKGMTHKQYNNQYLYPNGSSSITFTCEDPTEILDFPNFMWTPGTTFAIPENAIDLNGGTITEAPLLNVLGPPAIITNSASQGSSAGQVTTFHQPGELWVTI